MNYLFIQDKCSAYASAALDMKKAGDIAKLTDEEEAAKDYAKVRDLSQPLQHVGFCSEKRCLPVFCRKRIIGLMLAKSGRAPTLWSGPQLRSRMPHLLIQPSTQ